MSEVIPQDTPINRASIVMMDDEQLEAYVETLRERRLKLRTIYEAGQEAKRRASADKAAAQMEKALDRFIKKAETVDKGLAALEKLALDIQALRLVMGDL